MGLGSIVALLSIFLRHGRFNLYYAGSNRVSSLLAEFLRMVRILAGPPAQVVIRRGHRVDDPSSARLKNQAYAPNKYTTTLVSAEPTVFRRVPYPDSRVRSHRVELNLQKEIANTTFHLLQTLDFARDWHVQHNDKPAPIALVSPDAALATNRSPLPDDGRVEFYCPWTRHHSLLLRLARAFMIYGRQMVTRKSSPKSSLPMVATTNVWGLDESNRSNDLFWWWKSKIAADRVVIIFDHPGRPATSQILEQARDLGIRPVALSSSAAADLPGLIWRANPGALTSAQRLWREITVSGCGL